MSLVRVNFKRRGRKRQSAYLYEKSDKYKDQKVVNTSLRGDLVGKTLMRSMKRYITGMFEHMVVAR